MEIKVLGRKDWFTRDPFQVPEDIKKKYPNAHFVFIRFDEDRINFKDGLGYKIITKKEKGSQEEIPVRVGDTILMAIHEKDYEDRERQKDELIKRITREATPKAKEEVKDIDKRLELVGKIENK